jgi:hypothetical protein
LNTLDASRLSSEGDGDVALASSNDPIPPTPPLRERR